MQIMRFLAAFVCLLMPGAPAAMEIATGSMLGSKYDQRAFYYRRDAADVWRKTYSGPEYKRAAQGKLMNLRLAQALFHDEWLTERPFDPDQNTDAVIEALDFYRSHGILMINVSLQGGNPGYDPKVNGIARQNGYRYGPNKGLLVSAFRPDGSLKPEWMARLGRLLKAADQRGMFVNVLYFYQGQDEVFESTAAIHAAARNATDWLIANNHRNVLIDVANEYDLRGDRWDFARYIPENIIRLIEEVRERFQAKKAGFVLPISASSDGRMNFPDALVEAADFVLIHGNNRTPEQKRQRVAELRHVPRPVLMNEDDNGRATTRANLAKELASCDILFEGGAGWGYMPWVQAQRFPFRFMPGEKSDVVDEMPENERDLAYFHAVLDHIARLAMAKPPHPMRGK